MTRPQPLYRPHESVFRTQYSEVKERSVAAGSLLPGSPGMLVLNEQAGRRYWYRRYYPVPGAKAVDDFICKDDDENARQAAQDAIAFSEWTGNQVRALRKLDFQVADKDAGRVLVELHNQRLFTPDVAGAASSSESSGLTMVGTLAYMAWLNELGARAVAARTQDIDLARRQPLKLAAAVSFLRTLQSTSLRFSAVPSLSPELASTSAKLPGAAGLRVDLLADGPEIGTVLAVPELDWHAQTVPYFAYLLEDTRPAVMLAGGHAIPVSLPAPERFVWHKLYSSTARIAFRDKAAKDLQQAATLAAVLVEQDDADLSLALQLAPSALHDAARARLGSLEHLLQAHPRTWAAVQAAVQA